MAIESAKANPSTPEPDKVILSLRKLEAGIQSIIDCLKAFPGTADREKFQRWWDWRAEILAAWEEPKPCCERDHNKDGNCDVHSAPGVLRNQT